MSYRIDYHSCGPHRNMQKTTTLSEVFINNGETGCFDVPNYYKIVPRDYEDKKVTEEKLEPIKLLDEGYSDPVCILHDPPEGLCVASCKIKEKEQHVVEVILYAECPSAITEMKTCLFTLKAKHGTIQIGSVAKNRYDIVTQGKIIVLPGLI